MHSRRACARGVRQGAPAEVAAAAGLRKQHSMYAPCTRDQSGQRPGLAAHSVTASSHLNVLHNDI